MLDYQPPKTLLKDRVILVTGASRGIGRAVSLAAAQHGATVLILARSTPHLESLYDEITQQNLPEPVVCPFDLARATPEHYDALYMQISQTFGRLDGLVHNAAHLASLTPLEHYPIQQWYEVFQTNVHSVFLLTQSLWPLIKQSTDPSIIYTLANESHQGKAYWGAYSASKFALKGLMQIMADECENTPIRINSINPEKVTTRLRLQAYPGESKDSHHSIESLLPTYLYLLGPDSPEPPASTYPIKSV